MGDLQAVDREVRGMDGIYAVLLHVGHGAEGDTGMDDLWP